MTPRSRARSRAASAPTLHRSPWTAFLSLGYGRPVRREKGRSAGVTPAPPGLALRQQRLSCDREHEYRGHQQHHSDRRHRLLKPKRHICLPCEESQNVLCLFYCQEQKVINGAKGGYAWARMTRAASTRVPFSRSSVRSIFSDSA